MKALQKQGVDVREKGDIDGHKTGLNNHHGNHKKSHQGAHHHDRRHNKSSVPDLTAQMPIDEDAMLSRLDDRIKEVQKKKQWYEDNGEEKHQERID